MMLADHQPETDGFEGLDALTALVRECASSGVARRALLLRTDLLPPRLSRPHHRRLARAALNPLTLADRARTHDLPDGRVAVSWRGDAAALLQQSMAGLRHLLQDSPQDAPALLDLVRLFDLPRDGATLLDMAGYGAVRPLDATGPDRPVSGNQKRSVPPLDALDAAGLSALERQLATADVACFARRKPICLLNGDRVQLAWEKRFLSVAELTSVLIPKSSVTADAWLFRRLTRMLDRRMLALLAAPGELNGAGPFSLDLNVSSVLSPEFLRFDAALPPALRGQVVLDLAPADVMADPVAFAFARDFARARSYRLLLRSVSAPLLQLLSLDRLELDYVQLKWSPELADASVAKVRRGEAAWVLGHADDGEALRWGRSLGMGLFQGRALVRR